MEQELDFTIYPTDGPMTCIWKVMQGRGWLASPEILALLEDSHFAKVTLRNKLSAMPKSIVESRPLHIKNKYGTMKEFRVIEGAQSPVSFEITKPRYAPDNTAEKKKKQKQEAAASTALTFMNLLVIQSIQSK